MKTTVFRLICLLALLAPMNAASQTNIMSAFDAIIKCPKAEISESHSMQKDRETNLKSGQDDIYSFILPADRVDLIRNVMAAFDKDMSSAYVVKKGKNKGSEPTIQLYSGESTPEMNYVIVIDDPGCDYVYELFSPSKTEDPDGTHRYAYGFNYKEEDGKIKGKMVINYATTAEYRQQVQQELERERSIKWLADMGEIRMDSSDNASQQSWFEKVMACVNGLEDNRSPKSRIALATKAYKLVSDAKNYPDVSSQDRTALRQIFHVLKDKPKLQDPVLKELLSQCEAALN